MRRKLIKGAAIVSMDAAIGDLPKGDVLIEQDRIASVAPSIAADDADTIDASRMLLLPGLINGHLHTWQTGLRGLAADWTVAEYMQAMHRGLATLFRHGSPKPDRKPGQRHFSETPMPRREVERFCKGRFASRDGLVTFGLAILGPYYSNYDVTRADLKLAREL